MIVVSYNGECFFGLQVFCFLCKQTSNKHQWSLFRHSSWWLRQIIYISNCVYFRRAVLKTTKMALFHFASLTTLVDKLSYACGHVLVPVTRVLPLKIELCLHRRRFSKSDQPGRNFLVVNYPTHKRAKEWSPYSPDFANRRSCRPNSILKREDYKEMGIFWSSVIFVEAWLKRRYPLSIRKN